MKPSYKQIVDQAKQHCLPNQAAQQRVERAKAQQQSFTNNKKEYGAVHLVPSYSRRFLNEVKNLMQKKPNNLNIFKTK